jgi:hypothetical protein
MSECWQQSVSSGGCGPPRVCLHTRSVDLVGPEGCIPTTTDCRRPILQIPKMQAFVSARNDYLRMYYGMGRFLHSWL